MSKKTLPRAQRAQGSGMVWVGLVCVTVTSFSEKGKLDFPSDSPEYVPRVVESTQIEYHLSFRAWIIG